MGDPGSIPWLERSPGGGNVNPLQYSCLGNPMDWGAWWATVHGVAKSRISELLTLSLYTHSTSLKRFSSACWGSPPDLCSSGHSCPDIVCHPDVALFSTCRFRRGNPLPHRQTGHVGKCLGVQGHVREKRRKLMTKKEEGRRFFK